jgi:transcriptional regulator with XRE-family HTH domain
MSIGLKINELMESRGVRKTELSKYLNVARNTLDDYLVEKTYMTSDKIEKTAKFFEIPVGYFFGEVSKSGDNTELVDELKREIERLKKIIAQNNIKSSQIFLALPMDDDEFLDLREMKDKVIRILSK